MKEHFQKWGDFLIIILIFSAFTCSKNPVAPTDINTLIRAVMEEDNIPSLVVCIIKNDRIVWSSTNGLANIEDDIPATDETIYILGSVSKLIVLTAVMQLHEQGLINIDEDINNYLSFSVRNPHYPDEIITTRMLLTHYSSVGRDYNPIYYRLYIGEPSPPLDPWVKETLFPGGTEYFQGAWNNTAPGEQESYSNLGVALLGCLVEAVTGELFDEYCKKNIFQPLNMFNTSFRMADLNEDDLAMPYARNLSPYGHYEVRSFPSGGIRSSINDFSHFYIAYMNGGVYEGSRILEEDTIEETLRIQYSNSQRCLIWFAMDNGWYGHSGSVPGMSAFTSFHKDDKAAILIYANGEVMPSIGPYSTIYTLLQAEALKYQ